MIHIPQNFYKETITQDVPIGTTNIYVSVKPTVTSGWATISPASSSLREIVFFSDADTDETGDYIVISDAGDRGNGGTTEQTHVIGEPIRMNVGAETIQEISDLIVDATVSVKGMAKLPRISSTAGVTHSLTTLDGERVTVWASGQVHSDVNSMVTVALKYNTVTKHTVTISSTSQALNELPFSLMYTEIPGTATHNITVEANNTLSNVVIMVMIIDGPVEVFPT